MASASIKQINQESGLEGIKRTEISTKKEWVNIEEKGVDRNPLISYIYSKKDEYIFFT
jgi:hypothetical protein